MASVPIIIPIVVLIVALVALILSIYHFFKKLFGCPHKKSSYPFDQNGFHLKKSVLPTKPYTIDPSSNIINTGSNSVYFKDGLLLYPSIAAVSAPSPSPSPRDSNDLRKSLNQDETIDLDMVDHHPMKSLAGTPSPNSSNATREDTNNLLTVHSNDSSSPEYITNRWSDNRFESDV